jgi:hypothetical protein
MSAEWSVMDVFGGQEGAADDYLRDEAVEETTFAARLERECTRMP